VRTETRPCAPFTLRILGPELSRPDLRDAEASASFEWLWRPIRGTFLHMQYPVEASRWNAIAESPAGNLDQRAIVYPPFQLRACYKKFGRWTIVACLGLFFIAPVRSQTFTDLGFEQAVITPVPGDPYGRVVASNAFPAWVCYTESNQLTLVNYDNEFLDSAGVSILNTNVVNGYRVITQAFEGRYTALLQAGFALGGDTVRWSAAIAQTGLFSPSSPTMTFEASGSGFGISVAGQSLPYFALNYYPSYTVYGVDVSRFAGQTAELRFTAFPFGPPGLAINNVFLDGVRFPGPGPPAPPSIVVGPQNQTGIWAGSDISFAVFATASPAPAYQWFFNSNAVANATNSVLELTNVQFSQSGVYTIVVTNIYASTSRVAVLTVQDPFIVSSPGIRTVNAGQSAQFSVVAGGTQPLSFQWLKNGAALSDGGNISGARATTLTLTNVAFGDAGSFSVIVSNQYTSVVSAAAGLIVLDPFIISPPTNRTIVSGQTARFSVVAGGTQPLNFQWLKNGAALQDGGNISGARSAMLTLSNVAVGDAGGYSVNVSNQYSNVTSVVATLNVQGLAILSQPVSQSVAAGGTASFTVVAGGTTPMTYQWFDVTVPLSDGGNISGSQTATLTLANVRTGDADAYYVVVANAFSNVTSQVAFVDVVPPTYSIFYSSNSFGATALVMSGTNLYGPGVPGASDGLIFRVNTNGSGFVTLHTFTGYTTGDGNRPLGTLVLSAATLYGFTQYGGTHDDGTVFSLNTDGSNYTILKDFTGSSGDGYVPLTGPVLAGTTLYGTTEYGGDSGNFGTMFKINTDGSGYSVLKSFSYDSGSPGTLVVAGTNIYGTTSYVPDGFHTASGTLFKINLDGSAYTVISQLYGSNQPTGGFVSSGGTLYGVTQGGGISNNGTLFRINTDGSGFATLHNFMFADGRWPNGSLLLSGSTLYGTTQYGGISNNGTLFEVNTDGSNFRVLKLFRGSDGRGGASLILSGTTLYGATGILFALSLLPPADSDFAVATLQDQPVQIAVSNLLALATDPGGSGMVVTSVSAAGTNGGSVVLGPSQITYTPPAGYLGIDAFTYNISDSEGRSGTGRVFVQVLSSNQISGNRLLLSPIWGTYVLSFGGVPGRTYSVQRASTVTGPWLTLAPVTVVSQGFGTWADTHPPADAAFYRTSYP
jgi:uncharacterized repeat protein (TIGR03803 family)